MNRHCNIDCAVILHRRATAQRITVMILLLLTALPLGAQNRPFNPFNMRHLRYDFGAVSGRPMAMGGTAIGLPDDPTATTVNPAGVVFFVRPAISSSTGLIYNRSVEPTFGCAGDQTTVRDTEYWLDQTLVSAIIPFYGLRIASFRESAFDFRLGYNSFRPLNIEPGMSAADAFRSNFPSSSTLLRIRAIENGATVGWSMGSRINLGASLRLVQLDYQLTDKQYFNSRFAGSIAAPVCSLNHIVAENLYLIQSIDEKQYDLGISMGIHGKLSRRLVAGAVMHRRPSFELVSNIFLPQFEVRGAGMDTTFLSREDTTTRVRFDIPDTYGFGLAYKYRGWMNISIDVLHIRYSQLADATAGDAAGADPANLIQDDVNGADPDGRADIMLDDAWELRLGFEYVLRITNSRLRVPLRFGYYRSPSPIPHADLADRDLQLSFPKADSDHHFTGGLGFFVTEKLRLDTSIDYSTNRISVLGSSVYIF